MRCQVKHSLLDEIFYSECNCCKGRINYQKYLCKHCLWSLRDLLVKNYCSNCGFPTGIKSTFCRYCLEKKNFQYAYFNFFYNGAVKNIIRQIKFNNSLKAIYMLKHISKKILKIDSVRKYDIITTIPTHWMRKLKRFAHPADIIAKELSKRKTIPFKKVLKRHKLTKYQWTLERSERFKNVKGSFSLCFEIKGLNILLIDDIYTSGATLNEACLIMKMAGANAIDCYVLAKSVL